VLVKIFMIENDLVRTVNMFPLRELSLLTGEVGALKLGRGPHFYSLKFGEGQVFFKLDLGEGQVFLNWT
jgi:hypothetical protein